MLGNFGNTTKRRKPMPMKAPCNHSRPFECNLHQSAVQDPPSLFLPLFVRNPLFVSLSLPETGSTPPPERPHNCLHFKLLCLTNSARRAAPQQRLMRFMQWCLSNNTRRALPLRVRDGQHRWWRPKCCRDRANHHWLATSPAPIFSHPVRCGGSGLMRCM